MICFGLYGFYGGEYFAEYSSGVVYPYFSIPKSKPSFLFVYYYLFILSNYLLIYLFIYLLYLCSLLLFIIIITNTAFISSSSYYYYHRWCWWHHGEEKLKEFLDILNRYHPSVKFTSKYSREWIDFSDVEIIKEGNRLLTDVFVKFTDTHQYLHATSCHVYHSQKSIPYSQALRFNRICSNNQFFDERCNDLEVWLKNRGCIEKFVRQQILKARKYKTRELLQSQREEVHKHKLVFNISYYPIFSKLKNILSKIHLLLTPDREHSKVFENVLRTGFKKGKSLKDILWESTYLHLKPRRVSVVLAINQDVKFANILPKHTIIYKTHIFH